MLLAFKYVDQRRNRQELRPETVATYRKTLQNFAGSPMIPDNVTRLSRKHIERWIESRHDRSRATIRSQLSIVRQFCKWLVESGIRKTDPSLGVRGPRQPHYLPRGVDRAAVLATFDEAPDARAVLIICLEVQEGLRAKEVVGLELGDVDGNERQVLVRMTKGDVPRVLPISDETWSALGDYLAKYPAKAGPLIRSYLNPAKGISAHYVSRLVSQWMHAAGVNDSGHALRHTAATDMLRAGAHIRDVQRALGHRSIMATQIYMPWLVGDLRSAMGGRTYRTDPPPEPPPAPPGVDEPSP